MPSRSGHRYLSMFGSVEAFGWGDLSGFPNVSRSISAGLAPDKDSALLAWLERANARSSVATTFEEMVAPLLSIADAVRLVEKGRSTANT